MGEPVFHETLQLGIVVRDLETTRRRYVDEYGIGPWQVHEFHAGDAERRADLKTGAALHVYRPRVRPPDQPRAMFRR